MLYIYIYIYNIVLLAQIFPTLSRYPSLSSIASGRSSSLNPASVQGCCRKVLACRLTLVCPCEVVNWKTLLMSSSLLLEGCFF